jgi:hypothetical protein
MLVQESGGSLCWAMAGGDFLQQAPGNQSPMLCALGAATGVQAAVAVAFRACCVICRWLKLSLLSGQNLGQSERLLAPVIL